MRPINPSLSVDQLPKTLAPVSGAGQLQVRSAPLPLNLAVQMFSAFQGDKLSYDGLAASVLELAGPSGGADQKTFELSELLAGQGRMHEAEALLRQALAQGRAVHGSEYPEVLRLQVALAQLLKNQGRHGDARRLFLASVEVQRRVLGAHHEDTLCALEQLATLLIEQDDLRFAEPLLCEAVALRRSTLGDAHPTTLRALTNLAVLLRKQKRFSQAETLLRRTMNSQTSLLGEGHIDTLLTMGELAALLEDTGNVEGSEALFVRVLVRSEALLGRSHHHSLVAAYNYAGFLYNQGRMNDARPYLARVLEVTEHAQDTDAFFAAGVRIRLGECLKALALFESAERNLISGYDTLREALGLTHPRTQRVLSDLISLYEAWGKPRKAAPFRAAHAACS